MEKASQLLLPVSRVCTPHYRVKRLYITVVITRRAAGSWQP